MKTWVAWIAVVLAAGVVLGVAAAAYEVRRPLNVAVIDPNENCPSGAASGIEAYLNNSRNKLQAARVLVRSGQLDDERRVPRSFYARYIDYSRAKYAVENISNPEMARLLCTLPIIDIHGDRRAGVPSVATAILDRDIEAISEVEMSLITCGVLNTRPGAQRAMIEAPSADAALAALRAKCGAIS